MTQLNSTVCIKSYDLYKEKLPNIKGAIECLIPLYMQRM